MARTADPDAPAQLSDRRRDRGGDDNRPERDRLDPRTPAVVERFSRSIYADARRDTEQLRRRACFVLAAALAVLLAEVLRGTHDLVATLAALAGGASAMQAAIVLAPSLHRFGVPIADTNRGCDQPSPLVNRRISATWEEALVDERQALRRFAWGLNLSLYLLGGALLAMMVQVVVVP